MRGLAEFVMRGRLQALLVVMLGAGSMLFCWISAAVVSLVTLRRGAQEGALMMLWALLPAGAVLYAYGDSSPLALLIGSLVLAIVLRTSVSLSLMILGGALVAFFSGLVIAAVGGSVLDQLATTLGEFLASFEQQMVTNGAEPVQLPRPTAVQLAGMLGAGNGMMAVLCVLLARYWQAALYKPEGFGEEFRALRYTPGIAAACLVLALGFSAIGFEYRPWALMFLLPLSFAGLAVVHSRAFEAGWGTVRMIGFYFFWLLVDLVKVLVVLIALADSWFNFRTRWVKQGDEDE